MATSIATVSRPSLSLSFSQKYGIDQNKVFAILRDTALKSKDPVSDAEVAAFMVVCNQYELNPFVKEIFGFASKGKLQCVISVDGWATLVNRQANLNGIEFDEHFDGKDIRSITCKIHRKDRALPTVVTEYYSECNRGDSEVWKKWPIRMLRHKAMIQCSRLAFGLAGIMDEDEAERMSGYVAPTILEGNNQPDPNEAAINAHFTALGWNKTRTRLAWTNYPDNSAGLLEHLKSEAAKAGIKVGNHRPATIEPHQVDAPPAEDEATDYEYSSPNQELELAPEYAPQPKTVTAAQTPKTKADW